ncbi:hypothetical protein PP175_27785 (plasmid) [Aneurinibacillus sp. Ricciae_BoGa-3]|uniref:hypothetical protein n=1 Tax=Aneurinibacillus sp. Ricciae_BoGa-3 TaxID=3022697 RepID=UPI00234195FF|nr:hypothetical protein [Aneurinibacillus sp. Ricciae_BoGa-3]WCK56995.1 hypothetical protein PP175_27785 [Aneurinibacillus sp. Ricciae_BoGa-3]
MRIEEAIGMVVGFIVLYYLTIFLGNGIETFTAIHSPFKYLLGFMALPLIGCILIFCYDKLLRFKAKNQQ